MSLFNAGRAILGGFFILAGTNKGLNIEATLDMMAGQSLPAWLLPAVIALEIGGGAIVALGRPARWLWVAALALAAFTFATNIVFHRFWELEGVMHTLELSLFFKNLAIMGALLMVAGHAASSRSREHFQL